jgi:predicted TIM-barrel fold metal-dependent hydrolase
MHSPWGDLRVHDAHAHFFSHSFFAALAAQKPGLPAGDPVSAVGQLLGWRMPPRDPRELAAHWIHELDRHGVGRAVMIGSLPGEEAAVCAAAEAAPGRLIPYAMVNPAAADAESRLEKALAHGLRGICLFPAMHRYPLHDERVERLLRLAAVRPGTVVFVHCGVLSVGVRKKLELPSLFDLRFSNRVDVHALALQFPEIPFVIPHFGAGYLREALMVAHLCPNLYLDTSSSNDWVQYQPETVSLRDVFRRAIDVTGPGRLLFGTDSSFFPRGWNSVIFEIQARIAYEIGLSKDDAALIFGGNLDNLLRA